MAACSVCNYGGMDTQAKVWQPGDETTNPQWQWQAQCNCSWTSDLMATSQAAGEALIAHRGECTPD
jgi:hypothetical protein